MLKKLKTLFSSKKWANIDIPFNPGYSSMNYFYNKFGYIPNKLHFENLQDLDEFKLKIGDNFKLVFTINETSQYVYKKERIILSIAVNYVTICYDKYTNTIKNLEELLENYKQSPLGNIFVITQENSGLGLTNCKLDTINLDINLNYGEEFAKKHIYLQECLMLEKPGIILLHSKPGMGKSSYLHYLCNSMDKIFIFIPLQLSIQLSSPSFLSFLLNHCKNSVLIIEDAELLLKSREQDENSVISDILNISDGLLGKALNIKIIATYNTQRANIDKALLRKGRLLCEHEFKLLEKENSISLLKQLNIDFDENDLKDNLTLAEIYNYNSEDYSSNKEKKKVGFKI